MNEGNSISDLNEVRLLTQLEIMCEIFLMVITIVTEDVRNLIYTCRILHQGTFAQTWITKFYN